MLSCSDEHKWMAVQCCMIELLIDLVSWGQYLQEICVAGQIWCLPHFGGQTMQMHDRLYLWRFSQWRTASFWALPQLSLSISAAGDNSWASQLGQMLNCGCYSFSSYSSPPSSPLPPSLFFFFRLHPTMCKYTVSKFRCFIKQFDFKVITQVLLYVPAFCQ